MSKEASDIGGSQGSQASGRLLAHEKQVLERWLERLHEEVPASVDELPPVLINTFPAMLRQIAESMSPRHPRQLATDGSTLAEEHGGERARVTRFRLTDVIVEYRLLREAIVEILEDTGPLTSVERRALHRSIDQAVTRACGAYVLVQENIREQFFATLTHDLRGPLGAARANAGLVLRSPGSEHVPRWAARCIDTIDRVDRMIRDLLDAMRSQAVGRVPLELEHCDLVDVARQSVEHLQAEHGEQFILVAPDPVPGYFAPEALRRALENLASNAVKYGASLRPITIAVRPAHGRAIVTVHNHGVHIPAEQQETLFRAFHRLRQAETSGKRGWGLGLVQVRAVAESHGGSIGVDSLPEKGTTFTIDIPLDARPFQESPTLAGAAPRPPLAPKTSGPDPADGG